MKAIIEAPLIFKKLLPAQQKAIASSLKLPENRQADLLFMSAILVSTGTNKNGATFLGSELIKARDSISQKALNVEHEEQKIIGHIASSIYLNQEGSVIDDEKWFKELSTEENKGIIISQLDSMDMDIGIVCVVYKDRFSALAEEIMRGEWKVSMECYYEDFDIKIGNNIVSKNNLSNAIKLKSHVSEDLEKVLAGTSLGTPYVSRVLRDIRFCGVGIVKNPANERSIILESAKAKLDQVLAAEELFGMRMAASVVEDSEEVKEISSNVIQLESSGYFLLKVTDGETETINDSYNTDYNTVSKEAVRRSSLDQTARYVIVKANSTFIPRKEVELNETSEAIAYMTNELGDIKEIYSIGADDTEKAHLANRWGPADSAAGICISFEKYKREFPGRPNPGRILATHWCKLFNKPCPVLGADAHDKACLRNKFSRLTKEDEIFNDQVVPTPFNPHIPIEDTELLKAEDMPLPKPLNEALMEKEPENIDEDISVDSSIVTAPVGVELTSTQVTFPFSSLAKTISLEDRKQRSSESFAFSSRKLLPVSSKEETETSLLIFSKVKESIPAEAIDEVISNLVKAANLFHLETELEVKTLPEVSEEVKEDIVEEEYGIPRLQLFPLGSRVQVISAMSRFGHTKVEMTDQEKEILIANILKAASKFNINTDAFKMRINK